MRIRYEQPWFWPIVKYFQPDLDFDKIAIAFGDTIYCNRTVAGHVLEHEKVHIKHMMESKLIAIGYYMLYAVSVRFRRKCEIEAYQAQFNFIKNSHSDKELIEKARRQMALYMSSDEVYPNMISYEDALLSLQ